MTRSVYVNGRVYLFMIASATTQRRPTLAYLALLVTIFAAAYGPIVIREAQGAGQEIA